MKVLCDFCYRKCQISENGYGWWYDNGDGTYPVSCWQWIDGNGDGLAECYCFNEEGYLYNAVLRRLKRLVPEDRRRGMKIAITTLGDAQSALGVIRLAYEKFF